MNNYKYQCGIGTAVITAQTTDGSNKSAQCSVTVGYPITYKLNGGSNASSNPAVYTGASKIKLQNPTRVRYTFFGWYTDKGLTKKIKKIKNGSKQNITVYAKWSKVSVAKTNISSISNTEIIRLLSKRSSCIVVDV